MSSIRFTWDPRKDKANQKKHGVSFQEGRSAFYDPNARVIHDPDRSHDEDRFVLLGVSFKLRALVVCHAYREEDEVIRIISARKATRKEQQQYREKL